MIDRIRFTLGLAMGMTLAVIAVWASSAWRADAAPGPDESTIVNVSPERVLDTRDPVNLGLAGPFVSPVSQKLQITGSIPTATGTKTVVPPGATGVLLNVTGFNPSADGFVSIRPGDATGAPTTSSLNLTAGQTVPNSVQVSMPTTGANAGQIDFTFDALGVAGPSIELLIDVVGYTTNTGLVQLVADVALKANAADVYSKTESDARYLEDGDIELGYSAIFVDQPGDPANVEVGGSGTRFVGGDGTANMSLTGPIVLGGTNYGLRSVTFCVDQIGFPAFITRVRVNSLGPLANDAAFAEDNTNLGLTGCYTLPVNNKTATSHTLFVSLGGNAGSVRINSVRAIWSPDSQIP